MATHTLTNDRALVTAGGQGLGEEIAKTLARAGARTVVADINFAEAERVAREINADGGSAVAFQADVTRASEVAAMVRFAEETWQGIDSAETAVLPAKLRRHLRRTHREGQVVFLRLPRGGSRRRQHRL